MSTYRARTAIVLRAFCVCVLCAGTLAFAAVIATTPAHARNYSVDNVNINLTVNTDGSITVVEERLFNFQGGYEGVYWDIATNGPAERASDAKSQLTVNSVIDLTRASSLLSATSNKSNVHYEITEESDYTRVKVYSSHKYESASIRITYTVSNAVNAWSDTGELYWKFVASGWEKTSENVTCKVHLPAPVGSSITNNKEVRAWGHGPLTGNVELKDTEIVYTLPSVEPGEFAEARVTFPVGWLSLVKPSERPKMSAIMAEENKWASEANDRRVKAKSAITTNIAVGAGSVAALIVAAIAYYLRFKKTHDSTFAEKYTHVIPGGGTYHPAVLGSLYRAGKISGELFAATLVKMASEGVVRLEPIDKEKAPKKYVTTENALEGDYHIIATGEMPSGKIDEAAYSLLFDMVAPRGLAAQAYPEDKDSTPSLYISDMRIAAKKAPRKYDNYLNKWKRTIECELENNHFFVDEYKGARLAYLLSVVVAAFAGLVAMSRLFISGATLEAAGMMTALVVGVIVVVRMYTKLKPISAEAADLKARLEALRRWFTDFDPLATETPRDAKYWGELLVLAVALGVEKRVADALGTIEHEVFSNGSSDSACYDSSQYPTWYCFHALYNSRLAQAASSSYVQSSLLSSAELTSSSSSSGAGFGGGFSSGGGGGGGGGGGAF